MKHIWVIYDIRALEMWARDCIVLEVCGSLDEVKKSRFDGQADQMGVVFVYQAFGDKLIKGRMIGTVIGVKRNETS